MTPYRERREQGFYSAEGEATASTTTDNLAGLGAPALEQPDAESPEDVVEVIAAEDVSDLDSLTKAELLDIARSLGISPANAAMSKGDLRAAVEANR